MMLFPVFSEGARIKTIIPALHQLAALLTGSEILRCSTFSGLFIIIIIKISLNKVYLRIQFIKRSTL